MTVLKDHSSYLMNGGDITKEFEYLRNFPGIICVKDKDLIYHGASSNWAKLMEYDNVEQVVYKTDYDIPCKASELAQEWIAGDRKVINKIRILFTLEILNCSSGLCALIVQKTPIKSKDGSIIGVFCQGFDISNTNLFKWGHILNSEDQKIINLKQAKPAIYTLNPEYSPIPNLTPRQEICLFLLVRGKTIKQIAAILGLSVRTIEAHVDGIKLRLGCSYKSQIIEKAIDSGYLYYIPKTLLQENIF